jgi:hypothetical protein
MHERHLSTNAITGVKFSLKCKKIKIDCRLDARYHGEEEQ